jgi:hypothetical protein
MANIRSLNGDKVSDEDPQRGIWYGMCTYWTDDWDEVSDGIGGIPCCPVCGALGMQTTAADWFEGVAKFQAKGNPGYVNFVNQSKEQCKRPMKFMEWFKQWLTEHPNGRETSPRSGGD